MWHHTSIYFTLFLYYCDAATIACKGKDCVAESRYQVPPIHLKSVRIITIPTEKGKCSDLDYRSYYPKSCFYNLLVFAQLGSLVPPDRPVTAPEVDQALDRVFGPSQGTTNSTTSTSSQQHLAHEDTTPPPTDDTGVGDTVAEAYTPTLAQRTRGCQLKSSDITAMYYACKECRCSTTEFDCEYFFHVHGWTYSLNYCQSGPCPIHDITVEC